MKIINKIGQFICPEEGLNLIKLTLILSWISIFLSLAFNPYDLVIFSNYMNFKNFFFTNFEFTKTVIIIIGVSTIFFFPILLFIIFKFHLSNKINIKSNMLFILSIVYFLLQFIGLITTENSFYNSYFLFNSIASLIILYISTKIFSEKDYEIIFNIIVFLLTLSLIFYSFQYFSSYFTSSNNLYSVWGNIKGSIEFGVPRPTGLSRTATIVLVFLTFYPIENNSYVRIKLFLMSLCVAIVVILGSRSSMGLLLIFLILLLFISIRENNLQIKEFFKTYIYFPFMIIIFILLTKFTILQLVKHQVITVPMPDDEHSIQSALNTSLYKQNQNERTWAILFREFPSVETTHQGNFSSGRFADWKNIATVLFFNKKNSFKEDGKTGWVLNIFNNPNINMRLFTGFGVQGDRFLINQSASNSLVYAAASGGVAGLIALILFSIIGLYYAINCIFTINKKRFSWYQKASSIIILMILARSLLESSYAVFGIDSILFALCAITLGKKFDKIS